MRTSTRFAFNNAPTVTDGPFRFAQWSRGDHVTLVRNDGFFMGKPGLDRIVVKIVPDENTSVNLLKTHAIDYIFQASPNTYPALQGAADVKLDFVNVNGYESVQLNLSRPLLGDRIVREAIAYSIDKPQLVSTLTHGMMKHCDRGHSGLDVGVQSDRTLLPARPDESARTAARRRLGAGTRRHHAEERTIAAACSWCRTTRTRRGGRPACSCRRCFASPASASRSSTSPATRCSRPAGMGGILQLGKFDLSLAGWYAGIDPDNSSQYLCEDVPPGGYNYSRYCNPDMQAAQNAALTHYDRPSRMAAYYKIQELLARDNPQIFFWWTAPNGADQRRLQGIRPEPGARIVERLAMEHLVSLLSLR